jgi:hypothetical protein
MFSYHHRRNVPLRDCAAFPAYLAAELEVAHDDRDLGAGDREDDKHQEEETEQVVELVQPDGRPVEDRREEEN